MKFAKLLYSVFGFGFLISFIGIFASLFLLPRFSIGSSQLNTPAVLFVSVLFFALASLSLKNFLPEGTVDTPLKCIGYYAALAFIGVFVLVFGFFIIWVPLHSTLLFEGKFESPFSATVNASAGSRLYAEFSVGQYSTNGTVLDLKVSSPNGELFTKTVTLGKNVKKTTSSRKTQTSGGNITLDLVSKMPVSGNYSVSATVVSGSTPVREVRIFEQNS